LRRLERDHGHRQRGVDEDDITTSVVRENGGHRLIATVFVNRFWNFFHNRSSNRTLRVARDVGDQAQQQLADIVVTSVVVASSAY
jgi:hypothetical protein